MLYVSEIPDARALQAFYERYAEFKGIAEEPQLSPGRQTRAADGNLFISMLKKSGDLRGASVCDVGCSRGALLELMRCLGANVTGIETDTAAKAVLARKGIPSASTLDSCAEFDVICLLQVLEHLSDPRKMVAAIARALKPHGRLLISVPNAGEALKAGPTWVGFRVDLEHLNYFDLRTLSDLLFPHNLLIEQFWEYAQPDFGQADCAQRRPSLAARLLSRLTRCVAPAEETTSSRGTFVLTALARKA
jgi:SAM-dependent methyltransferase